MKPAAAVRSTGYRQEMPDALPQSAFLIWAHVDRLVTAIADDPKLVPQEVSPEERDLLAVMIVKKTVAQLELDAIRAARRQPVSRVNRNTGPRKGARLKRSLPWRQIGVHLGVTKQTAQERFANRLPLRPPGTPDQLLVPLRSSAGTIAFCDNGQENVIGVVLHQQDHVRPRASTVRQTHRSGDLGQPVRTNQQPWPQKRRRESAATSGPGHVQQVADDDLRGCDSGELEMTARWHLVHGLRLRRRLGMPSGRSA